MRMHIIVKFKNSQDKARGGGGGGGGGAFTPNFDRYVPRQSEKWGALERVEREYAGLRSELERENASLRN